MSRIMSGKGGPHNRQAAERRGRIAEWLAAAMYVVRGYRIVAWRWRRKAGEIDLICLRGQVLVFVEVKARRDTDAAIAAVDGRARARFEAAARQFLAERRAIGGQPVDRCEVRFDIAAVAGWRVRRVADAWREGDR